MCAGELRVPFTSGLLVGIGESPSDRIMDLVTLRKIHREHGNLQELIIQPFRAKPGTRMADWAEPSAEEFLRTISIARILFGATFSIQAPPNLSAAPGSTTEQQVDSWKNLLDAGMFFLFVACTLDMHEAQCSYIVRELDLGRL